MKKEAKELLRLLCVAFLVMMLLPLAYRVFIHFWPPEEKPHQTLSQFLEEAQRASCVKLLTKPIAKWSDADVRLEPEIYAWLKEQGNEILPWEWTEEARRKDLKGYGKCWQRIWKDQKSGCGRLIAELQKEIKRQDRELQVLVTIHTHRTNQIARLRALAYTNTFPCKVSIERLKKGRLWGWNKFVEVVECKDMAAVLTATNSIYSKEVATAMDESKAAKTLSDSIASSKAKLTLCEKLSEICDKSIGLAESESKQDQDELLLKSLVEVLKGARK